MEDRNSELLFDYLRSILYDSKIKTLDLEELDEPFRKLGRGLQFLQHAVEEMLDYSAALSQGNLSAKSPGMDNLLCVNLKNLHANLNHLTWQAKQVAAGDYSQHVSYLGEFSDAFNMMTEQLEERENQLKQEALKMQKRVDMIESYNELLMKMTMQWTEWVFIIDADTREIVYCNKEVEVKEEFDKCFCEKCTCRIEGMEKIFQWEGNSREVWEMVMENGRIMHVNSYPVEWRGRSSYVHVVSDVTEKKQEEKCLSEKAYYDAGTGIYNRHFFEEYVEKILAENVSATLCYLDMDGLKYVNDHYGHLEGDRYIQEFVKKIIQSFRKEDVFARIGGDEFCLVLLGNLKEVSVRKLEKARQEFRNEGKEYPRSFSYGIYEIGEEGKCLTLEEMIDQADVRMYEYKRKYKEKRE